MDKFEILKRVDHTVLDRDSNKNKIIKACEDAVKYNTASVCIAPCFVKDCRQFLQGRLKVCTVIGFPNGYNLSDVKRCEAEFAIKDGADELDMVINLTDVRDKNFVKIEEEIRLIKSVCGDKILKVIIETCMLNEEEKIKLCSVVSSSGADFIKTSTGFANAGAELSDIALFKKHLSSSVKIKAAGGISDFETALAFIEAGADRIGSSRLIKLAESDV